MQNCQEEKQKGKGMYQIHNHNKILIQLRDDSLTIENPSSATKQNQDNCYWEDPILSWFKGIFGTYYLKVNQCDTPKKHKLDMILKDRAISATVLTKRKL